MSETHDSRPQIRRALRLCAASYGLPLAGQSVLLALAMLDWPCSSLDGSPSVTFLVFLIFFLLLPLATATLSVLASITAIRSLRATRDSRSRVVLLAIALASEALAFYSIAIVLYFFGLQDAIRFPGLLRSGGGLR